MIMYHLGPQLGVWIMQMSTFSSVLINRFHCIVYTTLYIITRQVINNQQRGEPEV